jgi:hypothetical protein
MKCSAMVRELSAVVMLSVGGAAVMIIAGAALSWSAAARLTIAAVFVSYGVLTLRRAPGRSGKTILGLALVATQGAGILGVVSPFSQALMGMGSVWAIRSLLLHRSVLTALCDAMLWLAAAAAGLFASLLGLGIVGMLWCVLLVQSLYVFLPRRWSEASGDSGSHTDPSTERFLRALRAAEEGLEGL